MYLVGTWWTFILIYCCVLPPAAAYEVSGPRWVKEGDEATLTCPNPFEGYSDLHSVSWSFRGKPFYSHTFNETSRQPYQSGRLMPGPREFEVDEATSSGLTVHLRNITWGPPGYVQCQLITGLPAYEKKNIRTRLNIYRPPNPPPRLHRSRRTYRPGDLAAVTCEMGPAKPALRLNLFVNGEEVGNDPWSAGVVSRGTNNASGLSYVQLYFNLTRGILHDGQVAVTCEARHEDVYRLSDTVTLSTYAAYAGGTGDGRRANLLASSGAATNAGTPCGVTLLVCLLLSVLANYLGLI